MTTTHITTDITEELLTRNLRDALAGEPLVREGTECIRPRTYAAAYKLTLEPGVWMVFIRRVHRPRYHGRLALAALRRAGAQPPFVVPSNVGYRVSLDGKGADYALTDWLARTDFRAELAEIDARTASCDVTNQRIADEFARHPANIAAMAQVNRKAAIEAEIPAADADCWIVNHLGYTLERLAALAPSTRRDRRREARQAIRAGL